MTQTQIELKKATTSAYGAGYYAALKDVATAISPAKMKELTTAAIEKRIEERLLLIEKKRNNENS